MNGCSESSSDRGRQAADRVFLVHWHTIMEQVKPHRVDDEDLVLWQAYVSWNQFAWLHLVSAFTALRGALQWQAGIPGWQAWGLGAAVLLLLSAILRYWVRYEATARRVLVRNALTGAEIQSMAWEHVSDMSIAQGVIAAALGIGTLVFKSHSDGEVMQWRGVNDPEILLRHVQTLRRRRVFSFS